MSGLRQRGSALNDLEVAGAPARLRGV